MKVTYEIEVKDKRKVEAEVYTIWSGFTDGSTGGEQVGILTIHKPCREFSEKEDARTLYNFLITIVPSSTFQSTMKLLRENGYTR